MQKSLIICLWFVLVLIHGSVYAQPSSLSPMGMQGGPPNMISPQEMDAMKQEIKTVKTDASNFNKRAEFARAWIMQLVVRGKASEVQMVAPPGTIPRIKQTAGSSPESAYQELDNIFREMEKIEASAPPMTPLTPKNSLRKDEFLSPAQGIASKEITVINPTSKTKLWAKVYYPLNAKMDKKYSAVIYIPGALGYGSGFMMEKEAEIFAKGGFVVGIFDPDGRGKSGGKENWDGIIQQDGLNAFIKAVANLEFVDKENIGVVSRSYGIVLASGCLARYPDNPHVNYLIDVEGPSDRFYITMNDSPVVLPTFDNRKTADKEWWEDKEPINWISKIKTKYLRIQSERDHTQPENGHAIALINAATNVKYGGKGRSPWTRVNGPENEPNKIYTKDNPPKWLPGKGMVTPDVLLHYIKELSTYR